MQRRLAALIGAGALTVPLGSGSAATAATPVKKVTTKTFKGVTAQANQWGTVQITVTVRTTTTRAGGHRKVTRKYTDLGGSYSYHTARSQYIMSQALPYLRQEFLQAQTAQGVQMVSGATYTSEAFLQSLQSALLQVKKT
jgi:uncharacterized protein with FMN-binding domain